MADTANATRFPSVNYCHVVASVILRVDQPWEIFIRGSNKTGNHFVRWLNYLKIIYIVE